jgi:hypothetical protein
MKATIRARFHAVVRFFFSTKIEITKSFYKTNRLFWGSFCVGGCIPKKVWYVVFGKIQFNLVVKK